MEMRNQRLYHWAGQSTETRLKRYKCFIVVARQSMAVWQLMPFYCSGIWILANVMSRLHASFDLAIQNRTLWVQAGMRYIIERIRYSMYS